MGKVGLSLFSKLGVIIIMSDFLAREAMALKIKKALVGDAIGPSSIPAASRNQNERLFVFSGVRW